MPMLHLWLSKGPWQNPTVAPWWTLIWMQWPLCILHQVISRGCFLEFPSLTTLLLSYRVKQLVKSTQFITLYVYRWLQIVTGFSWVISVFAIYSDGNKLMEKKFILLHSSSVQFIITGNQNELEVGGYLSHICDYMSYI